MKKLFRWMRRPGVAAWLAAAAILIFARYAGANVSVSNIELNGSSGQVTIFGGNAVAISYVLADNADLGATINVFSNGAAIRALTIATNALATKGAGLSRGTNLVYWDGNDGASNPAGPGTYTVGVTALSAGHGSWTLLTTNAITLEVTSGGYYAYAPRGIAVDNNTNSAYFGRVFVGNAATGPHPNQVAGDNDSILKFNADGTAAADGAFGNGGYPMSDAAAGFAVPEKLRMGGNDILYMNDRSQTGDIVAFDPELQTNNVVLGTDNYFNNPYLFDLEDGYGWFSMDVMANATNGGYLWYGEYDTGGAGVWYWTLTNGVANPSDSTGTQSVATGGSLALDASGGLMLDSNFDLFVGQYMDPGSDTNNRCLMFTNALASAPLTLAAWAVGSNDTTFCDVYDTTIDARANPRYVVCAMAGPTVGGLRILNPTNGATLAANLDSTNTYYATAWDGAGNLYAASGSLHGWRVWSPPGGTNSATTVSQSSAVIASVFKILGIVRAGSQYVLTFSAGTNDAAASFTLVSSSNVAAGYATAAGSTITNTATPGIFNAVVPASGAAEFYRLKH